MRRVAWLLALAACEPIPPSGNMLAPVAKAPLAQESPSEDLFEEAPVEEGVAEPVSADRLASALGGGLPAAGGEAAPLVAPVSAPPRATEAPAPIPAPQAMPAPPPASVSWGIRLVSTVSDAQPPRAILGLPDGTEKVVQAGDLIPEVGVVVLAIGRDQVQVAEIVAQGDHASVSSRMIGALFPTR